MKLIVLFMSLFSFLYAIPTVNIDSDKFSIKDFELGYFIDNTDSLTFEDILSKPFVQGKSSNSLGINVKNTWIQIKVLNRSTQQQTLFLHQDLAFRFISLEYFEVNSDNALIKRQLIEPFGDLAKEQLNGSDSIFQFTLNPSETKTIYVHQKTHAYHFFNFFIFSFKESMGYLISQKVDAILIVGLLLALAIYNLFIFISSRYREYLYYSLYLISSTLWIFYVYGSMAHYLHIYGEIPLRFNFGIMLAPIFLALFIQTVFKTKVQYKFEHTLLNSIIFVALVNFIYGVIDFKSALELLSLSLTYALIIFMWIAISIYKKGDKLIKIFLLAHTFYLFFSVYALLYYKGFVSANYISAHGTGIGLIIEALLLSYLVSYKFKIMEQEREEEIIKQTELKVLAFTDSLTKLYNRRYLTQMSEQILALSRREKKEVSIIILDIDKFKNVNDTYGHQFGDEVLVVLSHLLGENQRESDVLCRYGGEEFVILLPNTSLENAIDIAQKIRMKVESLSVPIDSKQIFSFTISLGVADIDVSNEKDIQSALIRADKALYKAKETGRNKVCFEPINI